jgi:hypothetical protein
MLVSPLHRSSPHSSANGTGSPMLAGMSVEGGTAIVWQTSSTRRPSCRMTPDTPSPRPRRRRGRKRQHHPFQTSKCWACYPSEPKNRQYSPALKDNTTRFKPPNVGHAIHRSRRIGNIPRRSPIFVSCCRGPRAEENQCQRKGSMVHPSPWIRSKLVEDVTLAPVKVNHANVNVSPPPTVKWRLLAAAVICVFECRPSIASDGISIKNSPLLLFL